MACLDPPSPDPILSREIRPASRNRKAHEPEFSQGLWLATGNPATVKGKTRRKGSSQVINKEHDGSFHYIHERYPFLPARKLTRSSSARIRKSKHVLGTVSDSDSEGEAVTAASKSGGATGKRKPAAKGKSSSANRKGQPKELSSYSGSAPSSQESSSTPATEEKKCPMAGCDSTGHLNGVNERHFTLQACPTYHNLTMDECTSLRQKSESQLSHWAALNASSKRLYHPF